MNIAIWILEGDNKMKTLVNKVNPAIRMTAPEIETHEEEEMYFIPVSDYCIPMCIEDWELIEEEGEPIEEIPSNVDLEKVTEEYALSLSKSSMGGKEYCKQDFKAGAKWMAEQIKGGRL